MVMEAVAIKTKREDKEAQKKANEKAKRDKWKEDKSDLEQFR